MTRPTSNAYIRAFFENGTVFEERDVVSDEVKYGPSSIRFSFTLDTTASYYITLDAGTCKLLTRCVQKIKPSTFELPRVFEVVPKLTRVPRVSQTRFRWLILVTSQFDIPETRESTLVTRVN